MRFKIFLVLIFLLLANLMFSVALSVYGLATDSYLNDYYNYQSINNPQKYMIIDTLEYKDSKEYRSSSNNMGTFVVYGVLKSQNTDLRIVVGNQKHFDHSLYNYPIFKSKLTGDFFLKNAPDDYYNDEIVSFLMTMYFKISLFPLIIFIIFLYRKYYRQKL